jgi:IS30 family transposase
MGLTIAEIAKRLGRHRSTLYRDLERNRIEGNYFPIEAHRKAQSRAPHGRPCKLQSNPELCEYVIKHLKAGWSPEQISGRMRLEKKKFFVCHETIYRYIYREKNKTLYQYLHYKKPKRRRRFTRKSSDCRYGEIRLITKRPKKIEERKKIGHWEGDLIAFSDDKKKTVTTLVERKSRMVSLIKNETKKSPIVMEKIKNKFKSNPDLPCETITFDQGGEFAAHKGVEISLSCRIYYCEKRSPWQKGSNENMNGRLRRYLPRNIDIAQITQFELDRLANKMNNLPRKCLGFQTPKELLLQHKMKLCRTWR